MTLAFWDGILWNEPDNTNNGSYGEREPKNKIAVVAALLPQVRLGAFRSSKTTINQRSLEGRLVVSGQVGRGGENTIEMSDVLSFHDYGKPEEFEERIPLVTGLSPANDLHRIYGSRQRQHVSGCCPSPRSHVAAINWGLVAGKTQTYLPWDSWKHPYTDREPAVWFHEIFRNDGTAYKPQHLYK